MTTPVETLREVTGNLDCLVDPAEAREVRKELIAVADTFRLLASYAEAKGNAMESRLKGNIALAITFESACDAVFNQLPEWARW